MNLKKKIVFLSGTRADFGKIKSLIQILEEHSDFEPYVFVTGMHLMHTYGLTLLEIEKCNFSNNCTHFLYFQIIIVRIITIIWSFMIFSSVKVY